MKKCSRCGKVKNLDEFSKQTVVCKSCAIEYAKLYRRTKIGVVTEIYSDQRKRSKFKNWPLPQYTKIELQIWMFSQPIFYELYDNWVISGYKKMMKPSCDRKDDHKSYTLNNIQLMTWADNKAKGHYNTRIGIISSGNPFKPVLQFSINGEFIAEYISTREAARQSGIHQEGISSVCNKLNRISAGGYIWKFKNQMENSK